MDAPVVEMVLKANVSKEHAGVSATSINKWHDSVYIDKRFISQGKYLMSDWGNLSCSGVKIRYYGLRYNAGSGFFYKNKNLVRSWQVARLTLRRIIPFLRRDIVSLMWNSGFQQNRLLMMILLELFL